MKGCPRPISDDFINASPEQCMADGYPWILFESSGLEAEVKSSKWGQNDEQDRPE